MRTDRDVLQHVLYMLNEMEGWLTDQMVLDAKKWEKAQRWIGFVNGALWMLNVYTIDDLKDLNRTPTV